MTMFGGRLRLLRKAHKLTQEALAHKLQTVKSTISQYENGVNEPDYRTLLKFSEVFQVSTDYLLGKTDIPSCHGSDFNSTDEVFKQLSEDEKAFLLGSLEIYRKSKTRWEKGNK
ncbi:helix-turn-helix domain-containing protein [Paenibacillus elgii]|uniref:helix-turn-helix domain-containing protein n=1 Tax=Paenibacillus elgii TaxID=189691 RepID=UPI000248C235|nr:helix-turn-helix transcriptional regulator [Paenibacillus elgii]